MQITYLGHSSFLLVSGGGTSVVTDPYGDIGLRFPHVKADGVTVSHNHFDHCNISAVDGDPKVFDKAGNFSLGDIRLTSIERYHDNSCGSQRGNNLIFSFEIDGIRVCHMGDLGEQCTESVCSKLSPVDVLLIPIGGNYTIDAQEAKKYVEALKPKIVIPMHYFVEGLTVNIASPDAFLQAFDTVETFEGTYSLKMEELPVQTKILFLKRGQ